MFDKAAAKDLRRLSFDPERNFYMDVWAVSAEEAFGMNENADAFERVELLKSYPTFIGSWACLDHANHHQSLAIGENIDAVYTPEDYVRIVMAADRNKAERRHPGLEHKIATGVITDTSMGATLPGTPVTIHDGTQVPIEDIKVGDRVLTHAGTYEPVVKIHKGVLKTRVYWIKVAGIQDELPLTEEHPVWTMKPYMAKSPLGIGDFVEARDLEVGDFVSTPFFIGKRNGGRTIAFARLLGWFAGDGNLTGGRRADGIMITLGNHEKDLIEHALELFSALGLQPNYRKRSDDNGWEVYCNSPETANEFKSLVGKGARKKRLSKEILEWPLQLQREFLGYLFDADGCFSKNGTLHLATSSASLAHQIKQMLLGLGIAGRLRRNLRKPGKTGFTKKERIEYQLDVGKQDAQLLRSHSRKVQAQEILKPRRDKVMRSNGLYAPIRGIRVEDYEGPCIDLDVAGVHSYVAHDVAVHNCWCKESVCSICANVATDVSEFCDHIRYARGREICDASTNWEQKIAYEKNRGVVFFEDSIITDSEGADKNAKILNKLAAQVSPTIGFPAEHLYKVLKEMGKRASLEEKAMLTLLVENLTRVLDS